MSSFPTWEDVLLPILKVSADGTPRRRRDYRNSVADLLGMSQDEREIKTNRGDKNKLADRIHWAAYFLRRANLLSTETAPGRFTITTSGNAVLASKSAALSKQDLLKIPEFSAWWNQDRPNRDEKPAEQKDEVDSLTPSEQIARAHAAMTEQLELELLDKIKTESPKFFEDLVVKLLIKMGYGGAQEDAGRAIGKSGDEGIDGVIDEDRLGLDSIYIQAKRWEAKIDRRGVQSFVGSLAGKQATKGVFITTSSFQETAQDYVKHLAQKVTLIDGAKLAALCVQFNVGVIEEATLTLKRIDTDLFGEVQD